FAVLDLLSGFVHLGLRLVDDFLVTALRAVFEGFLQRPARAGDDVVVFFAEDKGAVLQLDVYFRIYFRVPALRRDEDEAVGGAVADRGGAAFKVQIKRVVGDAGDGIGVVGQHVGGVFAVVA